MTNNQLTRERLQEIAEDGFLKHGESKELARIALDAMDSEPGAYWRKAFSADGFCYADGINSKRYHDENPPLPLRDGDYWEVIPLYRHAQPAPVVPDKMNYQDGVLFVLNNDMSSIERGTVAMRAWNAACAAMLQAGTFIDEGTKQAGNHVENALDMVNSPVIPNGYVMVPKVPSQAHLNSIAMRYRHDFYLLNDAQKDSALATARQMYEECSGQGFYTYTLPAAPHDTPALNSLQSVDSVADTWIPVSERMPENKPGCYKYLVFETLNNRVNHDYWNVPDKGDEAFAPFWNYYGDHVTHWMPLPNSPQEPKP